MFFSALSRALTLLGAIPRQGRFSSLMPVVTRTVGVFLGDFLIRRFYYTIVNKLRNFHTLKHVNIFLKSNILTTKALYIGLLRPSVRHNV